MRINPIKLGVKLSYYNQHKIPILKIVKIFKKS